MRDAGGVREWRLSGRVSAISEGCVLHPLAAAGTPRTYLPCVRFASTHVLPAPPSPTNTHLSCRLATRAIQGPLEKRGREAAVFLPWDGGLASLRSSFFVLLASLRAAFVRPPLRTRLSLFFLQ